MTADAVSRELQKLGDPKKAEFFPRFFKTGPGQYGEGDVFIGITVPKQREAAKKFIDLPLSEIEKLLHHKIHEYRLTALMILTRQFAKATPTERRKLYRFYLGNTKHVNNWDLVDGSAREIVGGYLLDNPQELSLLARLAQSNILWERRIAIVATWAFIKKGNFIHTFFVAEMLLSDSHDLIHKAVGWMLREVGKMDEVALVGFLDKYYKTMPRTTLRYAIERFDPKKRRHYMDRG